MLHLQDMSQSMLRNFHTSPKEFIDYISETVGSWMLLSEIADGYYYSITNHHEIENYPKLINFDSEKIAETACHRGVGVHPDYRENHLQVILQDTAADLLRKSESYKYLMCTVSPENTVSRNNIFTSGYVCLGHIDHMYRNYPRDLMLLTLSATDDE